MKAATAAMKSAPAAMPTTAATVSTPATAAVGKSSLRHDGGRETRPKLSPSVVIA